MGEHVDIYYTVSGEGKNRRNVGGPSIPWHLELRAYVHFRRFSAPFQPREQTKDGGFVDDALCSGFFLGFFGSCCTIVNVASVFFTASAWLCFAEVARSGST